MTSERTPLRLIVLDLDGTLLGAAGLVSERNAAALHRASEAGARVVIATGRPPRWIEPLKVDVPSSTALCCNGGIIMDLDSGTVITSYPLDGARLLTAITELRSTGAEFSVGVEGLPEFGIALEPTFPFRGDSEVRRTEVAELCAAYVVKALIRTEPGEEQAVISHFDSFYRDDFTLTRSTNDGLIEISLAGITKGAVIEGLAKEWGISPEHAIAFGDMPNDIEMLRWAGWSVAMGNADDTVKAIASEVGEHHDHDAVAQVLERWF
ncbi:HAD family hydrolase [Glaciihabitans sp. UYNi722]|uniref:HAD family hydrolase n=1 Tax=Glaciihabitans sp. UYNi722 TaxID=3156344 RepID=UPI0033980813